MTGATTMRWRSWRLTCPNCRQRGGLTVIDQTSTVTKLTTSYVHDLSTDYTYLQGGPDPTLFDVRKVVCRNCVRVPDREAMESGVGQPPNPVVWQRIDDPVSLARPQRRMVLS